MKQSIIDFFCPGKAYNKKMIDFQSNFKKKYEERTDSEKLVCEAFFKINFSGYNDMRYYGVLETILILDNYIEIGKEGFYKNGYKKTICNLSEQYLKDKNIL